MTSARCVESSTRLSSSQFKLAADVDAFVVMVVVVIFIVVAVPIVVVVAVVLIIVVVVAGVVVTVVVVVVAIVVVVVVAAGIADAINADLDDSLPEASAYSDELN